ncbi:MAG: hypothetical protein K6F86_03905 [Lachnospiraceae bacterium]|nr:hypothetical protein [Lachnospiraceae bacterium]
MKDLRDTKLKMEYNIKLNYSPYFNLECKGQVDCVGDNAGDIDHLDPKKGVYVISDSTFVLTGMDDDLGMRRDLHVPLKTEITPKEVIYKVVFDALKYFLPLQYENIEYDRSLYGKADPDEFVASTVGLTYHHSFQKIRLTDWFSKHMEYDYEIRVTGENGKEYVIKENNIFDPSGMKIGEFDICRLPVENEKEDELYYDGYHRVCADVHNFRDYLEAIGNIPDFFERYNTEGWQVEEAVKRLRFLGVSEKEIEDFEKKGIIPRVTKNGDGSISRNDYDEFERECFEFDWRINSSNVLGRLRGGLPYLCFRSRGAIPMEAYLYVEYLEEERDIYQNELKEGDKKSAISAIVLSGYHDYEFGSIEVELTEDGPVRTG